MPLTKDYEVCGNPIPAQAFTCRFCDASQSVENFPKTRERVIRSNLEAGLPTVAQALERLERDLREARACGAKLVRIIHGYGSSGRGGKIRDAVRRELGRKLARGEVKDVTPGENFLPWTAFVLPNMRGFSSYRRISFQTWLLNGSLRNTKNVRYGNE